MNDVNIRSVTVHLSSSTSHPSSYNVTDAD